MKKRSVILITIIVLILAIYIFQTKYITVKRNESSAVSANINKNVNSNDLVAEKTNSITEKVIDDWKLTLVNYENSLPDDFKIELANIDDTRQFDKRAINDLSIMIKDARKVGVSDMWVQSAYRSVSYQQELFDKKINEYMATRKNKGRCGNFNFTDNK